jgi:Mg/Co/Ni transporter MgtE
MMSQEPPSLSGPSNHRGLMLHVIFRMLLTGDLLGIVLAIAIWIESTASRPGANMVLMALPLVVIPTLLCGCAILMLISAGDEHLGRREARVGKWLGITSLIVFGSLFAVG